MSFELVWQRIQAHQGELFRQVRGGQFTYQVVSGCVVPDRTNRMLPRSDFRKAHERWPLRGPGEIQDLQGPSYVYAILADPRIAAP